MLISFLYVFLSIFFPIGIKTVMLQLNKLLSKIEGEKQNLRSQICHMQYP